jgi:hypothetical protein
MIDFSCNEEGDRAQFFNALKYITALPVIGLSALQIIQETEGDRVWFGESQLFRLW